MRVWKSFVVGLAIAVALIVLMGCPAPRALRAPEPQLCANANDVAMLTDGHSQLMLKLDIVNANVRRVLCRFRVKPVDGPCDVSPTPGM